MLQRINEIRAKMRLLQEEKAQLQKEYQSLRDCLINHTCKLPQVLVPTSTDCTTDSKFLTLYTQTFGNFNYDAFWTISRRLGWLRQEVLHYKSYDRISFISDFVYLHFFQLRWFVDWSVLLTTLSKHTSKHIILKIYHQSS